MSFADLKLDALLVRNLKDVGYNQPRPIQAQAIGPILDGRDVIGLAKTGMGKTAAFITPIAHHLLSQPPQRTAGRPVKPMSRLRALVLCPTRELAQQVAHEATRICQGTVLQTTCAYGKVGMRAQAEAIARGVDMLIATPGRVRELLDAHVLELHYVRHVAIDEADRMLDLGFLPQISSILDQVPQPRQVVCFTATMPKEVQQLAMRFLSDPVHIEVDPHTTPVEHVRQHLCEVHQRDKVSLLLHLLRNGHNRGVLVFCRTRRRVGWTGTALQRHGISSSMIHGDRTQAARQRALDRFAAGDIDVLVATDVAARGLHIPAVRTVVNYDVPLAAEEYVHRIGRAGHGGGFGEAYTFVTQQDRERWKTISTAVGVRLTPETPPGFEPTVQAARRKTAPSKSPASSQKKSQIAKSAQRKQGGKGLRPSRKKQSRPIKKGEKPGSGVRRDVS